MWVPKPKPKDTIKHVLCKKVSDGSTIAVVAGKSFLLFHVSRQIWAWWIRHFAGFLCFASQAFFFGSKMESNGGVVVMTIVSFAPIWTSKLTIASNVHEKTHKHLATSGVCWFCSQSGHLLPVTHRQCISNYHQGLRWNYPVNITKKASVLSF